jgi:NAD-dependent DNA ligase
MDERTHILRLELTEEELWAIIRGLQMFSDTYYNPHLTDEQYDIAQSALGKIEEVM